LAFFYPVPESQKMPQQHRSVVDVPSVRRRMIRNR